MWHDKQPLPTKMETDLVIDGCPSTRNFVISSYKIMNLNCGPIPVYLLHNHMQRVTDEAQHYQVELG